MKVFHLIPRPDSEPFALFNLRCAFIQSLSVNGNSFIVRAATAEERLAKAEFERRGDCDQEATRLIIEDFCAVGDADWYFWTPVSQFVSALTNWLGVTDLSQSRFFVRVDEQEIETTLTLISDTELSFRFAPYRRFEDHRYFNRAMPNFRADGRPATWTVDKHGQAQYGLLAKEPSRFAKAMARVLTRVLVTRTRT